MTAHPGPKGTQKPADPSTLTRYFPWVRLWVELPSDPKFRTISRLAGQPVTSVIAVFVVLLADAANAPERGSPQIDPEDIASTLDLEQPAVEAILRAMQRRLLNGNRLAGWDRRQPLREDSSVARTRKWRGHDIPSSSSATNSGDVTQGDATVTQGDASEVEVEVEVEGEERRVDKKRKSQRLLPAATSGNAQNVTFHAEGWALTGAPPGSLVALPVVDGSEALLSILHTEELKRLFPGVDVPAQVRAMRAWLIANPKQRKTRGGILRFVAGWLAKEQNRARPAGTPPRAGKTADEAYLEQYMRKRGGTAK